jgi:HK97 family phage prohead protease
MMATESQRRRWAARKRDSAKPLYHRVMELRAADGDGSALNCVAATDSPCDFGGYVEVLKCDEGSVDSSSARSCLLNHKSDQVVGGIKSVTCGGGKVEAALEIDPAARTQTGLSVLEAVRKGYLKGISVGYEYQMKDTVRTTDERNRTILTVNRWSLREISITPIPADVGASVRALPDSDSARSGATEQSRKEPQIMEPKEKAPEVDPKVTERENELAKARAEAETAKREAVQAKREAGIRKLAAEHNVSADGLDFSQDEVALTRELLRRKAEQASTEPKGTVAVQISADAVDKANEAAVDGVLDIGQIRQQKDLGMRGLSIQEIGRRWLSSVGVRSQDLSKLQLARMLLGRDENGRGVGMRGAAVSVGSFATYVLVNAMDKAVLDAFSSFGSKTTYQVWTKRREVVDFKTFYGAGLSMGNLKKTVENVPFEEISKGDAGYSSALEMWGATISLTLQALINDDLNQFMDGLSRMGAIAQRTIDKEVYSKLANATWTNRTTAAACNLAASTLDAKVESLMGTAGAEADGEKLLVTPSYLIVPLGLRTTAYQLCDKSSQNVAPGSRYYNDGITPVATPFLTTAATASQSTWYLAGDQMFEACVVAFLRGMSTPQIEEYDQGAVASRAWKVYLPFVAKVNPAYGIWQATHS